MASKPTKKAGLLLGLAAAHFALSHLIVPLTAAVTERAALDPQGVGAGVMLLVHATRVLHFPLVSLALYPREWFPGPWVLVPMALNSLIWGCGLYLLARFFRAGRVKGGQ